MNEDKGVDSWDEEVVARRAALKCRTCGGVNPYVCACAKAAWSRTRVERKRPRVEPVKETLDQQWESFKALSFPARMDPCTKCNNGESSSYCACAKAKWVEWRKGIKDSPK